MNLQDFFKQNKRVALCFSGGVDSSYLLYAGKKYGAEIQPYYLKTEFQPEFEFEDAKKLANELGFELIVKNAGVFENDDIIKNDSLRCYHCKNYGLGSLYKFAKADGYEIVIDGSNADDNPDERPGMKALDEMGIISPLRMANLTKKEIRELSKKAGLFTWDKPAYACLATRIPTGTRIDRETLTKVEISERNLFEMGYVDFRVRVIDGCARLQVNENQMQKVIEEKSEILKRLAFDEVMLDLKPR